MIIEEDSMERRSSFVIPNCINCGYPKSAHHEVNISGRYLTIFICPTAIYSAESYQMEPKKRGPYFK